MPDRWRHWRKNANLALARHKLGVLARDLTA